MKFSDGIKALDQFYYEFVSFQRRMWEEVAKVLKPFLQFFNFFDVDHVHNMLAIMVNLQFKSLWVVNNLVGHGDAISLAFEYDLKLVPPFSWPILKP